MAAQKLYYVDLNLNQNELKQAVIENLAAAPLNPVPGQIYFNTLEHKFYYYTGTEWITGQSYTLSSTGQGTSIVKPIQAGSTDFVLKGLTATDGIIVNSDDNVITFSLDTTVIVAALEQTESFLTWLNTQIVRDVNILGKSVYGETYDVADPNPPVYPSIPQIQEDIAAVNERVSNQVYAVGADDQGNVYIAYEDGNEVIVPEVTTIDQVTGDVIVGINIGD